MIESSEPMPTNLAGEGRVTTSTCVSKSCMNINIRNQFKIGGVVNQNFSKRANLRSNYPKFKNKKRKGIRVKFIDDVAATADINSNGAHCVLFVTKDLLSNAWFLDSSCRFMLHRIETSLTLINAMIVKCTWGITQNVMLWMLAIA